MTTRRTAIVASIAVGIAPAFAQAPGRTYRIAWFGFTANNSAEDDRIVAAFVGRLRELGFVDGHNLVIEWRYAEGNNARYAEFAKEMVQLRADLVVAGTATAARAVVEASKTLPVVTFGMPDPVGTGLVASLSRPGGQVTGMTNFAEDLVPKRIELFKSAVPALSKLALVRCPECARLAGTSAANYAALLEQYRAVARQLGLTLIQIELDSNVGFPAAVQTLKGERADGVLLASNQINAKLRPEWQRFQATERVPVMSDHRASGYLLTYGPDYAAILRRVAEFVARVLNGANPGELPMEQPTMVELTVHRGVALALGLTIPQRVLARADLVFD